MQSHAEGKSASPVEHEVEEAMRRMGSNGHATEAAIGDALTEMRPLVEGGAESLSAHGDQGEVTRPSYSDGQMHNDGLADGLGLVSSGAHTACIPASVDATIVPQVPCGDFLLASQGT